MCKCVCVCVKEAFQNPPNLGGDHFVMVELKDKKNMQDKHLLVFRLKTTKTL